MKRILKWASLGLAAVLLILVLAGGIIYVSYPVIESEESREVAASPDAMFAAFMDFDHWQEYCDIDTLYPLWGKSGWGRSFTILR